MDESIKKQIERITAMENKLNEVLDIIGKENLTSEELLDVQPAITELALYYGSADWKEDLEADEKGLLPATLKRGVLSEDGIYNMLLRNKDLFLEGIRGS